MKRKIALPLAIILFSVLALSAASYAFFQPTHQTGADHFTPAFESSPEEDCLGNGETAAIKNETVYVMLGHEGQTLSQVIVNRLYDQADHGASQIVDYGDYQNLDNMTGAALPLIEDSKITWDSCLLNSGDLYYQGTVEKALPVDVAITYYLDGAKITPGELAGNSGRLEIAISFTNNLKYNKPLQYEAYEGHLAYQEDDNYVPMVVQGTVDLDLSRFTEIDPGEGTIMVMGQNASLNFMVFPYPEAELRFSMEGKDIELERFSFMMMPQMPPVNDLDIEEALIQMLEGIEMFDDVFGELSFGAAEIEKGLKLFVSESNKMGALFDDYQSIFTDYENQKADITALLERISAEAPGEILNDLLRALENMESIPDAHLLKGDLEALAEETVALDRHLNSLAGQLKELEGYGETLANEAEIMVKENEPGSPLHETGLLILAREELIKEVIHAGGLVDSSLSAWQEQADLLQNRWLNEYLPGFEALERILQLAEAEDILAQVSGLNTNLDSFEDYFDQADAFIKEAEKFTGDLSVLPSALGRLADGQSELTDALQLISSGGLKMMKDELINGINEARAGQAKLDLMKKLADDYRSYADNERNRHSEVRFIVQTPNIKVAADSAPESPEERDENKPWTEIIWLKIINLF